MTRVNTCGADERPRKEPEIGRSDGQDKTLGTAEIPGGLEPEISFLKVDGNHPIPRAQGMEGRQGGFNAKVRKADKAVEARKVDDWPPTARDLRSNKHTAVKTGFRGCRFYGTLHLQVAHRSRKS